MKYGTGEGESRHTGRHCPAEKPSLQHYSKAERSRSTIPLHPEVMNTGAAPDIG